MAEHSDIDSVFKDKLQDLSVTPPPSAWSGIENNLPPKNDKWKKYFLLLLLLLLLMTGVGGYLYMNHLNDDKKEMEAKDELIVQLKNKGQSNPEVADNNQSAKEKSSPPKEEQPQTYVSNQPNYNGNNPAYKPFVPSFHLNLNHDDVRPSIAELALAKSSDYYKDPQLFAKETMDRILFWTSATSSPDFIVDVRTEIENNWRDMLFNLRGFHFGPIFDFNSTYILKENTYGEFGVKKLAYQLTFGDSYGLNAGYDFNSRYGVQAELLLNSSQGQKYADIFSNRYGETPATRAVYLEYDHLPIFFKYKISTMSNLTNHPVAFNFIGGIMLSKLLSASETVNGQPFLDITNRFNRYDYSALFGLEYDMYLGKRFFFDLGLRGTVSIRDINSGKYKLDPALGISQNMLLGANVGLNYLIR